MTLDTDSDYDTVRLQALRDVNTVNE